ncbi:MAG: DUF4013 domain-containing protein [Candidatus Gastranaerophilaceae bacterium]|jgi:hypothetical protein
MLDIKKALTVPFSDELWTKKIGIAALLYLPAFIASLQFNEKHPVTGFFYALASFIITGYAILAANNEINNKKIILPQWNFLNCIINSLKLWLVNLGWLIILMPFISLLFFISAFFYSFIIIASILGFFLVILYVLVVNIAQSLFLEKLEIRDAFNFKNIIEITKKYSGKYFFYVVIFLIMAIIYGIIAGVMTATFSFLINKAFGFYIAYVINIFLIISSFNLLAQVIKEVRKEDTKDTL